MLHIDVARPRLRLGDAIEEVVHHSGVGSAIGRAVGPFRNARRRRVHRRVTARWLDAKSFPGSSLILRAIVKDRKRPIQTVLLETLRRYHDSDGISARQHQRVLGPAPGHEDTLLFTLREDLVMR